MSKYQVFVLVGEYETEAEAVSVSETQEAWDVRTLIRKVETGVDNSTIMS